MKMNPGAQNMKMGPDVLGAAENEFESAKHKKGPDAYGATEKEFESGKHEN
jgi:hypothetical protein